MTTQSGMQVAVKNEQTMHYRELMKRVIKSTLEGRLIETVDAIPNEIFKDGDKPEYFDTIEHERAVARKQLQSILGQIIHSSRPMTKPLSECAKEALSRPTKPYTPQATVINEACHRCAVLKCYVTDACEGCFARPCQTNCPKKAISRVNGKAHIDQSLCIGCQLCLINCPYGAIMKRRVPCMDNCPVDAITKDAKGHSTIDPEKCIHCGRCTIRCAFGAIVMPSQVVDVFRKIRQGKNVIAMLAPATMVQFGATVGQLRQAVLKLGFKEMVEVALGADNTSLNESAEFLAEVATGKQPLMTTSCCPAWVRAIKVHVPGLVPYISTAGSPMKYTGDLVKKRSPDSITVFIGPCTAKRTEGAGLDNIDHVLTAEELLCAFNAQEIEPSKLPKEDNPTTRLPSAESTAYCGAQNVTAAVVAAVPKATYLNQQRGEGGVATRDLQPVYISPLDKKSFKQVKIWGDKIDQIPGNLIECMNCEGGCISGPGNIISGSVAQARFKQLMKERPQFNDIEDVTVLN